MMATMIKCAQFSCRSSKLFYHGKKTIVYRQWDKLRHWQKEQDKTITNPKHQSFQPVFESKLKIPFKLSKKLTEQQQW